jgi:hypothetical protein
MCDRVAQPLEKITDRIASDQIPAGKKPCDRQKQDYPSGKTIHNEWALCTTLRTVQIPSHFVLSPAQPTPAAPSEILPAARGAETASGSLDPTKSKE